MRQVRARRAAPAGRALLACALLAAAGCSGEARERLDAGPAVLESRTAEATPIRGTVLAAAGLAIPSAISYAAGRLVVLDDASDSVVHVFRAEDGARLREFGRRGAGPGEFKGAWSVAPAPGETDGAWIYDLRLRRMTHVALASAAGRTEAPEMVRLDAPGTPTGPLWTDAATIVSPGFFGDGRLAVFDARGRMVRMAGAVPGTDGEAPAMVRQEAFVGTLVRNPARPLLAVVTRHADRVEVYGADGTRVGAGRGPFGFDPRYVTEPGARGPVMGTGDDLRFGYVDAAATGDRVFALFSGRTRAGYRRAAPFGRSIHVFDWTGRLRSILRLDADVLAIAVSPDGTHLYALRHDPTPAVLRYPLPVPPAAR